MRIMGIEGTATGPRLPVIQPNRGPGRHPRIAHNHSIYEAAHLHLSLLVLVGVIGGSGLYHLDNLTFLFVLFIILCLCKNGLT